jgi:hypothetical protein
MCRSAGGLMGFEVLPWEDGDEHQYDVFDITRDTPWKPRQFRDEAYTRKIKAALTLKSTRASWNLIHARSQPTTPKTLLSLSTCDYALPILNDNDDHEPYYFDPRMQSSSLWPCSEIGDCRSIHKTRR